MLTDAHAAALKKRRDRYKFRCQNEPGYAESVSRARQRRKREELLLYPEIKKINVLRSRKHQVKKHIDKLQSKLEYYDKLMLRTCEDIQRLTDAVNCKRQLEAMTLCYSLVEAKTMPQQNMSKRIGTSTSKVVNRVIQNSKNQQQPVSVPGVTKGDSQYNKAPVKV